MGRVGGIGCLVPRSGPNLALFESCGAMDGESCEGHHGAEHVSFIVYRNGCYARLKSSPVREGGPVKPQELEAAVKEDKWGNSMCNYPACVGGNRENSCISHTKTLVFSQCTLL